MIKKILVANRGEIAMRIFRTCRVMNISTVAVYTHVDRGALHVRYAEEAYCISESPEDTSYLKPELILSIAKKTGAAIHPGYGFLSENADFARRCEEEGVIFIGPSADIISKMGIKTEARKIMREAGLPIVPGTETPVQGIDEVKKVANEVGYPIMLKALAGGGGKGMRLVRTEEEVETALRLSQSEAGTSFGNDAVYIEKYIENPHHIEVQIMGDKYGNVVHLYERECSIQRRNQKVIEESPSPFVKEETRKKIAVNGKIYEVDYNMGGDSIHSIIIDHHSHGVQISPSSNNSYTIMNKGELYQIELQGEMEKIHNARTAAESVGRQVVQAPMPGVILKTYVKKGDLVKRGDPLCVLVAMKMENEIRSVTDGVVKEVFVEDGMKVGLNDRIMVIE